MRKSAEAGFVSAQFKLGEYYHQGKHVAQSYKNALKWYREAAEQGHEGACFNLGLMYKDGENVKRSTAKAMEHFELAAQNNAENCELLARFLEDGELGPPDELLIQKWRERSRELESAVDGEDETNVAGYIPGRKSRKLRLNEKRSGSKKSLSTNIRR
jgi:TPR repeat protein